MQVSSVLTDVRYWIFSAIVIGLIFGDIGGQNDGMLLIIFLMIMMCFSLTKLSFAKGDFQRYRKKIAAALLFGSLISTGITLAVGWFYGPDMWKGWVILACVPCAISVVSGTMMMKGDGKLITLGITAVYLLAVVLTPLFTFLLIGNAVSPLEILKYVLLFIAIPLAVAVPLKKAGIPPTVNSIVINFSFFMFALIAIGRSRDIFFSDGGLALALIAGTAVRILAAHLIFEFAGRWAGLEREERIPLGLLLIWKNSGLALTLTMMLLPDETQALAPAAMSMIFEQFYFMFMLWYYRERVPPAESDPVTA